MKLKFIKLIFSVIVLTIIFSSCKPVCYSYTEYNRNKKNHNYIKWNEKNSKNPYMDFYKGKKKGKHFYGKRPHYIKEYYK